MAAENINEKYSIKNLLFYRATPTHSLPEYPDGHKIYACKDCGDRFLFESSYEYHIQRKSVQITYKCRHCSPHMVFYNRCNLLSHIRSHTFKTATINVSDLKIDPLPLNFYKFLKKDDNLNAACTEKTKTKQICCFECQKNVTNIGPIYKDRANHYMEYTNKVYSCPVCLFTLPTTCGLKAHLRIHLKIPPFYCPECGMHMANRSVIYPFSHSCEGFNMMRATTRHPCPIPNCNFFHPNDYKKHMKDKHLKKIFSCPACVVACFNESTMLKHVSTTHNENYEPLIFYQCELCPGRLVMQSHLESHLNNHKQSYNVYPCWICSTTFNEIPELINHHLQNHDQSEELKNCLMSLEIMKKVYRVVKRCDQCNRNFTYKCHYEDINILPNACPFKCTPVSKSILKKDNTSEICETYIKCPLCRNNIDDKWVNIKKHFALHHKDHRCMDAVIALPKVSLNKYLKKCRKKKEKIVKGNVKRLSKETKKVTQKQYANVEKVCRNTTDSNENNVPFNCGRCKEVCETKAALENHIITKHRDPCMAYQCMECGDCFVVKPSFTIHLLFHGISDVDEYINKNKCYYQDTLSKSLNDFIEEPLYENQCKICKEQFDNTDELKKHFRVHGMAFLLKNSINKPNF